MVADPTQVEFFFDPICPWAYQTSIWIRDVSAATGLVVDWRFFSLEEINRPEGKKHPWERPWSYGWSLMRVAAHLRRKDPELVDRWYKAVGRDIHEEGRLAFEPEGAQAIANELGLGPTAVADAIEDPTTHDDVHADHDRVTAEHNAFGVPTLVFPGHRALFGPTVVPAPRGPDALALWRVVAAWLEVPGLYEMQTPKTAADVAAIADNFEPYLRSRKWQSIQNPPPPPR
ncbi:MAG: DsbA family oxidoreductase [Acidimicrobiales bacterium]